MPLFEYRCEECKRKCSLLVGVTSKKEKSACPKCGSRKITKLISRISPIVRGDDFGGGDLEEPEGDLGDDDGFGSDDDEL